MQPTPLNFWFEGRGPSHFYKFRSVDDNTKKIITNHEMYFNSADAFNDPFDFLPTLSMKARNAELKKYFEETLPNGNRTEKRRHAAKIMSDPNYHKYEEQALRIGASSLAGIRKNAGILCIAACPNHMLLWGHYADSHKGIALRFKPKKGDKYFENACSVTYQQERPEFNFVTNDTITNYKRALLTKADFWSYEKEWRIFLGANSKGAHKFPSESLDGIILGAKITTEDENKVRDWVRNSGHEVEWLRAIEHPTEFRLEISPC